MIKNLPNQINPAPTVLVVDTMLVVKDLHYSKIDGDNFVHMTLNLYLEPITFLIHIGNKIKTAILLRT